MGKKIVVIKIGSSTLITKRGKLDEYRIAHIAQQAFALKANGLGVVFVVSGAVACGSSVVAFETNETFLKSVAAGIGQVEIIATLREIFNLKKMQIAQLLLTKDIFNTNENKQKIKKIIKFYINSGVIPIINENDVVDLHSFSGNDYLASEITQLLNAEKLLILSTYDVSNFGVGGGTSKQDVLNIMKIKKVDTTILNGKQKNSILNAIL